MCFGSHPIREAVTEAVKDLVPVVVGGCVCGGWQRER